MSFLAYKWSSYSISPRFCPRASREAIRWNFSNSLKMYFCLHIIFQIAFVIWLLIRITRSNPVNPNAVGTTESVTIKQLTVLRGYIYVYFSQRGANHCLQQMARCYFCKGTIMAYRHRKSSAMFVEFRLSPDGFGKGLSLNFDRLNLKYLGWPSVFDCPGTNFGYSSLKFTAVGVSNL